MKNENGDEYNRLLNTAVDKGEDPCIETQCHRCEPPNTGGSTVSPTWELGLQEMHH